MPSLVIVGAQWGDEGKGKITDLWAESAQVVARYQGGSNAGHTVVAGGQTYKLHLVPAGILRPGVTAVIGNGVVVDPAFLLQEMETLAAQGVDLSGLRISDRAHVVMPYHILMDQLEEERRPAAERIGTTGRGIGPCYVDKAQRTGIRMGDLTDAGLLRKCLDLVMPLKNAELSQVYGHKPLDVEEVWRRFADYGRRLKPYVTDTGALLRQALRSGQRVLLEGANGALLDIDHGTYPFVTSSTPTAGGAASGSGIGPTDLDAVVGVAKAYTTRVGEGPFPTELKNSIGDRMRERGHEYGTTTGRPRRCGWFDAMVVRHAAQVNGMHGLALMHLDVLAGLDTVKICTGYRRRGELLPAFPASLDKLAECEPVYEELPGWTEDGLQVTAYGQLPAAVRGYVERISAVVGLPVVSVSVGPERSQTLVRTDLWQAAQRIADAKAQAQEQAWRLQA
ncbi:MAG: adenylosuccinate synthase [Firmicutes bacterium]|nr:adenylosuccinate synthase [Bacillota bacterium]